MAEGSYLEKSGVDPAVFSAAGEQWRSANISFNGPVTNGAVLELAEIKAANPGTTWKTVVEWLSMLYGDEWPGECLPQSLSSAVARLKKEMQSFRFLPLGKDEKKRQLMDAIFVLPAVARKPVSETEKSEVGHLQLGPLPASGSSALSPPEKFVEESESESESESEGSSAIAQQKKKARSQTMYRKVENLGRKVKRRDSEIDRLERELAETRSELHMTKKELYVAQETNQHLKQENRRLSQTLSANKKRSSETLARQSAVYARSVDALSAAAEDEELETLQQKNKDLRALVTELETSLLLLQEDAEESSTGFDVIETFDSQSGSFKPFVRTACMTLLSHHVALEHIGHVIRSVVNSFTGREVGRLPSIGLLSQFQTEMKAISLVHAAEKITESSHSTLHTDATTKFFRKYSGYQVSTKEGSFSLGLLELHTGSAQHTLEAFQSLLSDINLACSASGIKGDVGAKLVGRIKNTMSDRGSVEKAFNNIFDDFRSSLLPSLYEDWEQLTDDVRGKVSSVNHFFCGLHYLVGLAEQSEAVFSEWEKVHFKEAVGAAALPGGYEKGSAVVRLIRTACKAFTKHGSEQAGCYEDFRAFVEDRKLSYSLTSFRGNRFNILFYNGGAVYYLHEIMVEFLETARDSSNRLLSAVLADLKVPDLLAGCRALGIFRKLVTGPLWRILEKPGATAISMTPIYTQLAEKLKCWAEDASDLLDGSGRPFDGAEVLIDAVFDSLVSPSEATDATTLHLLQLLCTAYHTFSTRLLADHLPGGKYADLREELQEEASTAPTTNRLSESDFGLMDNLLRAKPNATTIALEGVILFTRNKTREWLLSKPDDERTAILDGARALAPQFRENYKQRMAEIQEARVLKLKKIQEKKNEQKRKRAEEKTALAAEIGRIGFWTVAEDVHEKLRGIAGRTDQVKAVKAQIKFRRIVMGQQHDNKVLFQWSSGGRQFPLEELTSHLVVLVEAGAHAA